MGYKAQRFGFSISRGWTLLLLVVGLLVAASFWIGPLRPIPAELQLLAVGEDGVAAAVAAGGQMTEEGTVRFAVPLAVRNVGAQPARPQRLMLNVPARFHVTTRQGRLRGEVAPGVPLRRYVIDLRAGPVPADSAARQLPQLDTIWLEPDLPAWYCVLQDARIPEFVPAPAYDPGRLANVSIFYAFRTAQAEERHTGLLNVRLNPEMLQTRPAARPPVFETVMRDPAVETPELGALRQVGTRTAYCGEPEQPVELYTVLWETLDGGRFLVIYVDGQPRKHLYDLNRDGIVELETWDVDEDSRHEARREARFPIPEFLMPRPPRDATLLEPDTVPPDSAWLALFRDPSAGPWRFGRAERRDSVQVTRADALPADSVLLEAAVAEPDSAWLALFNSPEAGPFRFTRPRAGTAADTAGPQLRPRQPLGTDTLRPGITGPDTARADTVQADTVRQQPPPRPRRREPLGTPVPPRRDTIPAGQR